MVLPRVTVSCIAVPHIALLCMVFFCTAEEIECVFGNCRSFQHTGVPLVFSHLQNCCSRARAGAIKVPYPSDGLVRLLLPFDYHGISSQSLIWTIFFTLAAFTAHLSSCCINISWKTISWSCPLCQGWIYKWADAIKNQ